VLATFFWNDDVEHDPIPFAVVVIILACFSHLAALGDKIVIERDWVVAIARTQEELAKMNVVFQSIDLACDTLVTVFVGMMIDTTGLATTAVVLGIWNMVSAVCEYSLLQIVYKKNPMLTVRKRAAAGSRGSTPKGWLDGFWRKFHSAGVAWKRYWRHPTRNAGLSLTSIETTVLSFGNVLWAYCLLQCVSEPVLCVFSGLGAVSGILGSLSFTVLRKRFGVEIAGQVGRVQLQIALVACVMAMYLPGSPWIMRDDKFQGSNGPCPNALSVYVLMSGVVGARYGLWLTDIATQQIQQLEVEEEIRGTIGGVQESLNSSFDMTKNILVLLFPRAADFGYLVFASFGSLLLGGVFYTSYAIPKVYFPKMQSMNFYGKEITPLLHGKTHSEDASSDTSKQSTQLEL